MSFILKAQNFKKNLLTEIELKRLIIFPVATIIVFEIMFLVLDLKSSEIFSSITKSDLHSKILSVNASLAGFLFTGLNILISSSGKKVLKLLNKGPYLKITQNGIMYGIYCHLASILLGFVCIVNNVQGIQPLYVNLEFLLFLIGVVYFIMTMWEIKEIIEEIRKENLKESESNNSDIIVGLSDEDE